MPNVTYDSVGGGVSHVYATSANWSHTIGAGATCLVVGMVANNSWGYSISSTCTVGTTPMTSLGVVSINSTGWVELFGLIHPPTGAQTISYQSANTDPLNIGGADSVAYTNVASFGTPVITSSNINPPSAGPVTSTVGNMVVGVLGCMPNNGLISPSGTPRFAPSKATSYNGMMIEDAPGATSVTLTTSPGGPSWAAVAVNLVAVPGTAWTASATVPITATFTWDTHVSHQIADSSLSVTATTSAIAQELLSPQQKLTLQYLGPPAAHAGDVVTQDYIDSLLSTMNITQNQINSLITSGFSSYATMAYLNNKLVPLASQSYVQAGTATKIPLAQVNNANGVAGLSAAGRIPLDHFPNQPSTQRWLQSFWSPSSYGTLPHTATTETNLYSLTVSPSLTGNYKLFVTGLLQAGIDTDGVGYPLIRVRQGNSTTGQIIAIGRGMAESYPITAGQPVTDAQIANYVAANAWADLTAYVPAPASEPTTFSATALLFAWPGNSTAGTVYLRIVSNTGVVVATGSKVHYQSNDTVTIPSTVFPAVGGQQYGLQGYTTNTVDYTSFQSGYMEMSSAGVLNVGEVTILPQPLDAQTPITGSTTLYVNALRSGSSGTVTVSSFQPKLSVLAIPA